MSEDIVDVDFLPVLANLGLSTDQKDKILKALEHAKQESTIQYEKQLTNAYEATYQLHKLLETERNELREFKEKQVQQICAPATLAGKFACYSKQAPHYFIQWFPGVECEFVEPIPNNPGKFGVKRLDLYAEVRPGDYIVFCNRKNWLEPTPLPLATKSFRSKHGQQGGLQISTANLQYKQPEPELDAIFVMSPKAFHETYLVTTPGVVGQKWNNI